MPRLYAVQHCHKMRGWEDLDMMPNRVEIIAVNGASRFEIGRSE